MIPAARVAPIDLVVDVADHQLGRQAGGFHPHRLGIAATGANIVENPLLMAVLLLDVFGDRLAQPLQALRQARTTGHQQRHRMLNVVIGLAEKRQITGRANGAGHDLGNDRRAQQVLALNLGLRLQLIKKMHLKLLGNVPVMPHGAADHCWWPGRCPR